VHVRRVHEQPDIEIALAFDNVVDHATVLARAMIGYDDGTL
jgi:hypothetical protein